MSDDARLDTKLAELNRELTVRPLGVGFSIADAFTMKGYDETGKPGLYAAVLLGTHPSPSLDTLTSVRGLLAARLKQLETTLPQWPIVVQGEPEVIDSQAVVPGGKEYFAQVKAELVARRDRMRELEVRRNSLSQMRAISISDVAPLPVSSKPESAPRKPEHKAEKPAPQPARRRVAGTRSTKGARAARR